MCIVTSYRDTIQDITKQILQVHLSVSMGLVQGHTSNSILAHRTEKYACKSFFECYAYEC